MSDADFYIGRTINQRYEIVSLIGTFSLGESFRSFQENAPNEIALSLFWNGSKPCYDALTLHLSKPLTHENILTVFDFGRDEASNILFIVTEAFEGEPLSAVLNGRPFDMPFTSRLFEQLCAGVKAAHACGITHGALEPQNIVIRDPRGAASLKLMNFGVRTILEDHEPIDDRVPEVRYNPYYFSPEQIKDHKPNERSDIYALGCLLYAMLSGHPPYYMEESDPFQVLFTKLTEEPMRLSDINPEISHSLTDVVMKAISTDPLQRYASVDDLLNDFLSSSLT